MPHRKPPSGKPLRQTREERHDALTATVKGIVDKQKGTQDAKTARLRDERLARDATSAPPEKKKPTKKAKR